MLTTYINEIHYIIEKLPTSSRHCRQMEKYVALSVERTSVKTKYHKKKKVL